MPSPYRPLEPYKVFAFDVATLDSQDREYNRREIEYALFKAGDETQAIELVEKIYSRTNDTTRSGFYQRVLGVRFVREGMA